MSKIDTVILEVGTDQNGMEFSYRPYNLERLKLKDILDYRAMLYRNIRGADKLIKKKGGKISLHSKISKFVKPSYFPAFKDNYSMWPIRFSIKSYKGDHFVDAHGWQNGYKNGKRHYGWTLHIGKLLVKFGNIKLDKRE